MWDELTAAGQLVRAEGAVWGPGAVQAPISGAPCLLYRVELSLGQRLREVRRAPHWELRGQLFHLGGDDPRALLVDASCARIRCPARRRYRLRLGRDQAQDARLAALYRRLSRQAPPALVRCSEVALLPGQRVCTTGLLQLQVSAAGAGAGYRCPPLQPKLLASEVRWLQ